MPKKTQGAERETDDEGTHDGQRPTEEIGRSWTVAEAGSRTCAAQLRWDQEVEAGQQDDRDHDADADVLRLIYKERSGDKNS